MSIFFSMSGDTPAIKEKSVQAPAYWLVAFVGNVYRLPDIDAFIKEMNTFFLKPAYFDQGELGVVGNMPTADPVDDFNRLILEPLRARHTRMPLSAPVAVIFDCQDCHAGDEVFDAIVKAHANADDHSGYFQYYCVNSKASETQDCTLPHCSACPGRPSQCRHSCFSKFRTEARR